MRASDDKRCAARRCFRAFSLLLPPLLGMPVRAAGLLVVRVTVCLSLGRDEQGGGKGTRMAG